MSAGLVTLLVAGGLAVVLGSGTDRSFLDLGDGFGWFGSTSTDGNGELVRANGLTGEVTTRLAVPESAGKRIGVEVRDGTSYVVVGSGDDQRMYRVDESGDKIAGGAKLAPAQQLMKGGNRAYFVREKEGEVLPVSPIGLAALVREPVTFGGRIEATATAEGRLAVVTAKSARLSMMDGAKVAPPTEIGEPGDAIALATVGGVAVAVNSDQVTAHVVDHDGDLAEVDVPGSGELVVPEEGEGGDLTVLRRSGDKGVLAVVDLDALAARAVDIRAATVAPYEAPLSVAGAAYLLDRTSSAVLVVDTTTGEVHGPVPIELGNGDLETYVKDGMLWVNDPAGKAAVTVQRDGTVTRVTKRDEKIPVIAPEVVETPPPVPPPVTETVDTPTPAAPTPRSGPSPVPAAPAPTPTAGQGTGPAPAAAVQPPAMPVVVATPGNRKADLSWTVPNDGGAGVTGFRITYEPGGSDRAVNADGAATGAVLEKLKNGTEYTVTVVARNQAGDSPPATVTVRPTSEVPEAPTGVTAAPTADGSVNVAWEAADGNGNAVTKYQVFAAAGQSGVPAPVSTTPVVETTGALTAVIPRNKFPLGTDLDVTVTAVTGAAPSPASEAAKVRVLATPGVAVLTLTGSQPTNADLRVACDLACRGGSDAATFALTLAPGGAVTPASGKLTANQTTAKATGLNARTSYTARVKITNEVGNRDGNAVTFTTQGAPIISAVQASASGLNVTARATVDEGQLATTCRFDFGDGYNTTVGCGESPTHTMPTYNVGFTVTVTASNAAGTNAAQRTGSTGTKPMTANGDHWGCPSSPTSPYCGPDVSRMSGRSWNPAGNRTKVGKGTSIQGECQTTGDTITDPAPGGAATNLWVRTSQQDGMVWMSAHYFGTTDFGSVVANLPGC